VKPSETSHADQSQQVAADLVGREPEPVSLRALLVEAMSGRADDYTVTPTLDGTWLLQCSGIAAQRFPTVQLAVVAAEKRAIWQGVDVLWANSDGNPQGRRDYRTSKPARRRLLRLRRR
jgi:hypothetical protein